MILFNRGLFITNASKKRFFLDAVLIVNVNIALVVSTYSLASVVLMLYRELMESFLTTNLSMSDLRKQLIAQSTKPFKAKGSSVNRCSTCLLGDFACMCAWKVQSSSSIDIVLILHRAEICKPTNTGRLIQDIFPEQTYAFCWDRLNPSKDLLNLLGDKDRECVLIFPVDTLKFPHRAIKTLEEIQRSTKKSTLVFLDGTWRQASKMFRSSQWLMNVPSLNLNISVLKQYKMRKSQQTHQLSTAEAACMALSSFDLNRESHILHHYFQVFNEHYLATRNNTKPNEIPSHHFLSSLARNSLF